MEIQNPIIQERIQERNKYERNSSSNSRNGKSSKTIKTGKGAITIDVPRDRYGSFELLPVRKGQTENGILDHQVIAQYSEGMISREIIATIKEMYDVYISPSLVSHITDSVIRKATTRHRMFPDVEADMKVVRLAIMDAFRRWTMPIRNWKSALNRFCIEFEDRISACL